MLGDAKKVLAIRTELQPANFPIQTVLATCPSNLELDSWCVALPVCFFFLCSASNSLPTQLVRRTNLLRNVQRPTLLPRAEKQLLWILRKPWGELAQTERVKDVTFRQFLQFSRDKKILRNLKLLILSECFPIENDIVKHIVETWKTSSSTINNTSSLLAFSSLPQFSFAFDRLFIPLSPIFSTDVVSEGQLTCVAVNA